MWKIGALLLVGLGLPLVAWAQEAPPPKDPPPAETPAKDAPEPEAPAAEAPAAPATQTPAAATSAPTTQVEVELNNGITLKGVILTSDAISWAPGKPLLFTPDNGAQTTLTGAQIKAVRTKTASSDKTDEAIQKIAAVLTPEVSSYRSPGGFGYANVGKSRHLYAPSGIGLKEGQGYFSQKWIFSSVAYGVTDNLTLLAGTFTFFPPALTIAGGKVSGEIADGIHIAAGGEVFMTGMDGFDLLAKVGFGGITFGHDDRQITLSSGYMGLGDQMGGDGAIPVIVAGQWRLTNRSVLVTENWLVLPTEYDDQLVILSAAYRLLGGRADTRMSSSKRWTTAGDPKYTWDFGFLFFAPPDSEGVEVFGPIPWIDFAWAFGKPDR